MAARLKIDGFLFTIKYEGIYFLLLYFLIYYQDEVM